MANQVFLSKTSLIGGGATALDSIDGAGLVDGDFAVVTMGGNFFLFKLDDDSGVAESYPWLISPDTNAGNKRWILQGQVGSANQKLFTKADESGTEWATGEKLLIFTRNLTATGAPTDVSYTGATFKPSTIIFFSAAGGADRIWSFGIYSINTALGMYSRPVGAGYQFGIDSNIVFMGYTSGNEQSAVLKTLDTDGFTLTWTKTGSPTGTYYFGALCLR